MYTLFIDTHGDQVLTVLYKDSQVFKFEVENAPQNHCTYAIPILAKLINSADIKIKDVNEIFVVIGPGSFTGVRIGVTIAKTLAYTLNIPIKPISTLTMYALGNNKDAGKLIAVPDPKGYYFGMFNQLNEAVWDFSYLSNDDFNKFIKEKNLERMVLKDDLKIDLDALYKYLKDKPIVNPHDINPIYIKSVEVENG